MIATSAFHPVYACPDTHEPLRVEDEALVSVRGERRFAIVEGIPRFLGSRPVESEEGAAQLERLTRSALEVGWFSALHEVYRDNPDLIGYTTDEKRCSHLELLPIGPEDTVFELGPGLGQFTVPTARRCGMVYALEVVPGQARFVQIRCGQSGVSNVSIACGGDDCRLPYLDGVFDVAIVNLVFEWCASRTGRDDPGKLQRRLLSEIHRVLKPGGTLYLNTKNRFSLHYLTGGRDEHAQNLRFGSALPRGALRRLLAALGKEAPAGMLYSHDELSGLLRRHGYCDLTSYWAVPEMRYPERFVKTDAASIRLARRDPQFKQGETRRTRMLMRLIPTGLVRHFTRGLLFIARKPPAHTTVPEGEAPIETKDIAGRRAGL